MSRWRRVESPFGAPSDELCFGRLGGAAVVFLPRHGRGHRIPPGEINFRANIDALKRAGVTDIISLSAVGSLKPELPPGSFVLVDQFIDRTFARVKSFFGTGCVAHVSMAHPVCARLGDRLAAAGAAAGIALRARRHLSSSWRGRNSPPLAESNLYRSWGCDVIGMTNMPEAKLAREAEICYATVAMVTDFDCWHPDHDHVTVAQIIGVLTRQCGEGEAASSPRRCRSSPPMATARRAAATCSTTPSSPRPRRAIRRWWRGSTRSPAACSKRSG